MNRIFAGLTVFACYLLVVIFFPSVACTPPPANALKYNPVISHATWEASNYEKIFDGVVRALHTSGYMILAADKGSGLITVEQKNFPLYNTYNYVIAYGYYKFNTLVFAEESGAVTVSIKWTGHWTPQPNVGNCDWCAAWTNNKIASEIEMLFQNIEVVLGKPSKIGRNTATWN